MNIAKLASRDGTITWALSIAVLVLGWLAFEDLSRLADPRITIREARVITPYPGAAAAEVEGEVSVRIEKAARQLDQVRRVESYSTRGLSVVSVLTKDQYDERALPRIWDELRRRVADTQPELPPGAGPSTVDDEVGKVYGLYYGLTGEGFTPAELRRITELLQRDLSTLEGVKKLVLFGEQQEAVLVEISMTKAKALGLGLEEIFATLRSKNLPADAGHIRVGPEHVPIYPSRLYRSEQDLGDLMIAGGQDRLVRLGDIAKIRRDYEDPPRRLLRIDGRPAIGIAVSTISGTDLVAMGETVEHRFAQLTADIPLGMELKTIALEPSTIVETMDDFAAHLLLALVLIIAALMFFMGPRGGLIIGFATLLTLAGTLIVMDFFQFPLDRISLGALVMVSGMLTSNAIFVVNGSKVRMDRGLPGAAATGEAVARYARPLLATTAATVLAFSPIGGMDSSAGEYARGLFLVILISLPISWAAALTIAPLLAGRFLRSSTSSAESTDSRASRTQDLYARALAAAIRRRRTILGATVLLLALSIYGFGFVKQIFLPLSTTSGFMVEVYFREGTHIRETERQMDEIQTYLRDQADVTQVTTVIGAGHPHYLPIYGPWPDVGSHYGASLVLVDDQRRLEELRHQIQADLSERYPDATINAKRYAGIGTAGGRIQLRISGPDPSELRRMADQVKALIATDPDAKAVRDDWGAKVKVAQPVLAGERARRLGIDRTQISRALRTTYSGSLTGFYREGTELLPIVARAQGEERGKVEDMARIEVTSPLRGDRVSMRRLADRLDTLTEDARRIRRGGRPVITTHADADQGLTSELLERIRPRVEKALVPDFDVSPATSPGVPEGMTPLRDKPGYFIGWGGEAGDWSESVAELEAWIPVCFGLAVLVIIALFNALRQPLIILTAAPLPMIGVTAGLLLTGQPFGFLSLLGVTGLAGMLIGNAILLVDQIDLETRTRKARLAAIIQAASSRMRPIGLATGTSILAMLPLLMNDLFAAMAVAMISGLGIATLLMLVLVPVLYASLFGIRNDETP